MRRSVFGGHLLDMTLFDELVGRVDDVLLSSEPLVQLQQLVHLLLKTGGDERMRRESEKMDERQQTIFLLGGGGTFIH